MSETPKTSSAPDEVAGDTHPRADVLAEEYRGRYLWDELEKARARVAALEEQYEKLIHSADEWRREALRLEEQLRAAETTLAHAEAFIEHQDMSYRWAEWCEGRDPSPASRPEEQ